MIDNLNRREEFRAEFGCLHKLRNSIVGDFDAIIFQSPDRFCSDSNVIRERGIIQV
jgi:hypothetical protein